MATGKSPSKSGGHVLARQQLSMIREELTCSICGELFKTPKILPCLHNFCLGCLQKFLEQKSEETLEESGRGEEARNELVCPLCNDHKSPVPLDVAGVQGLKTNFSFKNLVSHLKLEDTVTGRGGGEGSALSSLEESPQSSLESEQPLQTPQRKADCVTCGKDNAISFCTTCNKALCSFCDQYHQRATDTENHQRFPLGQGEASLPSVAVQTKSTESSSRVDSVVQHNPWKCDKHPGQDVEIYCKPCNEVMCVHCAITKHKTHDYDFAHLVAGEYRRASQELVSKTKQVEQDFEEACQAVGDRKSQIETSGKDVKEKITRKYNKMVAELGRHRDQLVRTAEEITKGKADRLQEQIEELKRRKMTLRRNVKFASDVQENCIDIEFLFLHSMIKEQLEKLCKTYSSLPRVPRENDAIQITMNEEFLQKMSEINTIGRVFADAHVGSFTVQFEDVPFVRGKLSTFKITSRDIAGGRLFEHQDEIQVEIQPEVSGQAVPCLLANNEDGTYTATVQPQTLGPHNLVIFVTVGVQREAIVRSPYRIVVVPPHRQVVQTVQVISKESTNNKMKNPWGIVITKDAEIVVSDVDSNSLLHFDRDLNFRGVIGKCGSGKIEFKSPRGLAVTPSNHVIVAEKQNNRLQEITLDQHFVRYFGLNRAGKPGSEPGYLNQPTGVAVDSQGTVLVTDTSNKRVQCFQADGTFLGMITQWGQPQNPLVMPYAIHVFHQPNTSGEGEEEIVFITEKDKHRVHRFKRNERRHVPTYHTTFGEEGNRAGQLKEPVGIAVDPRTGYVFIVEMNNHRISLFSRNGDFITTFGTRNSGPLQFHNPMNVAVLNSTDIIVTECGGQRIVVLRVLEQ